MKLSELEKQKKIDDLQKQSKERSGAKDVQGVIRSKALIAYYKGQSPKAIVGCFGISYKSLKRWVKVVRLPFRRIRTATIWKVGMRRL